MEAATQYWIREDNRTLIRAKGLREAVKKAEQGFYALCDGGQVWCVADTIPNLLRQITHSTEKDLNALEKALCDENYVYWRIYPVSKSFVCDFWQFHQQSNRTVIFPSYRIEDGHVLFEG